MNLSNPLIEVTAAGPLDTPRELPSVYRVHEAGQVQEDGSQQCHRCGLVLLDAPPTFNKHSLWGFGIGRRIAEMPISGALYLVTVDRQLAPDEVPCR